MPEIGSFDANRGQTTSSQNKSGYIKDYRAFTELSNSKYPENSPETVQKWPYDFRFLKKFSFSKSSLRIDFEIISEANMPFMLGYHPAFKLRSTSAVVYSKDVEVSLNEICN